MESFNCPECGATVEAGVLICPICGYPFEPDEKTAVSLDDNLSNADETFSKNKSSNVDGAKMHKKHSATTIIRRALVVIMIAFFILAIKNFNDASYVKNKYYSSDTYSVNAYVGGDAYNYIINGTYFTGYCVKGIGFLISGVLCGVGAAINMTNNKGEE